MQLVSVEVLLVLSMLTLPAVSARLPQSQASDAASTGHLLYRRTDGAAWPSQGLNAGGSLNTPSMTVGSRPTIFRRTKIIRPFIYNDVIPRLGNIKEAASLGRVLLRPEDAEIPRPPRAFDSVTKYAKDTIVYHDGYDQVGTVHDDATASFHYKEGFYAVRVLGFFEGKRKELLDKCRPYYYQRAVHFPMEQIIREQTTGQTEAPSHDSDAQWRYFFTTTADGNDRLAYFRQRVGSDPDAPAEEIFNVNRPKFNGQGLVVQEVVVAPDPRYFAVLAFHATGRDCKPSTRHVFVYGIRDTPLPKQPPAVQLARFVADGPIAWSADSHCIYYTLRPRPATTQFMMHLVQAQDCNSAEDSEGRDGHVQLYDAPTQDHNIAMAVTSDKRLLISGAIRNSALSLRFIPLVDSDSRCRMLPAYPRAQGMSIPTNQARYSLDSARDYVFLQSTTDSQDRPVVLKYPLRGAGPRGWTPFLTLNPGDTVHKLQAFQDFLVVFGHRVGHSFIQVYSLPADLATTTSLTPTEVDLPLATPHVSPVTHQDFHGTTLYFLYESPLAPPRMMGYDMKQQKVVSESNHFNPADLKLPEASDYATELVHAPSHDGQQVPLVLMAKPKVFTGNRKPRPMLIQVRGGYGKSLTPRYRPEHIWLMDQGWIIATPFVRGGGECGHRWYQQGRDTNKLSAVHDFLAASRFVIAQGYTQSSQLAATGRKSGGFLIATALNAQPDLFRAVYLDSPMVDVIGRSRDLPGQFAQHEAEEYGDPKSSAEAFHRIMRYSPYEHIPHSNKPLVQYTSAEQPAIQTKQVAPLTRATEEITSELKDMDARSIILQRRLAQRAKPQPTGTPHLRQGARASSAAEPSAAPAKKPLWPSIMVHLLLGPVRMGYPYRSYAGVTLKWVAKLRRFVYPPSEGFTTHGGYYSVLPDPKGNNRHGDVRVNDPRDNRWLLLRCSDEQYLFDETSHRFRCRQEPYLTGLSFLFQQVMGIRDPAKKDRKT
ncbi:hypothetical protein H4R34_001771 [Dimargaris verticillata]|uniref:Prolyl endopeptidase-like n=1 Tax=Dimargaris verticillata TaxID=2761393 RepID=A0A9W8EDH0_9FUNG|nr:hypothetical protein H4R34_001771 [Dimargaris verticillata]